MKYMSRDQVLAVLQAARNVSERDFVMILLAYRHGMRASEVCRLTIKDFSGGQVTIKRLKGSERTTQTLFSSPNPLLDELTAVNAYIAGLPRGAYLFPARKTSTTVSKHLSRQAFFTLFRAHCQTAGIPAHLQHPHSLKHSIAMELVRKVTINELQAFLGHVSLASTGMYLKVNQPQACAAVSAAMNF